VREAAGERESAGESAGERANLQIEVSGSVEKGGEETLNHPRYPYIYII